VLGEYLIRKGERSRSQKVVSLAIGSNPGPTADSIEQDIMRVSTSFPHREPGKTRIVYVLAFRNCFIDMDSANQAANTRGELRA
jgi:hypothetical protein